MEDITLLQYYKDSYEKTVRDTRQPLFITRKENPFTGNEESILLVPEFLLMTGIDDEHKNNENLKREMISLTKMDPRARMGKISEFRNLLVKNDVNDNFYKDRTTGEKRPLPQPDEIRSEWGMEIHPQPLEVKGRILPLPNLKGSRGVIKF
jgi:hypothetical protein